MFKRIIKKPFILVKSLQKSETCTLIGSLTKPNCFNQGEQKEDSQTSCLSTSLDSDSSETNRSNLLFYSKEFLSKYEIINKIGKGMQGEVFKVKQKKSGELLAAKIYMTEDDETICRIKMEVEILNIIRHQNIVEIKEFLQDPSLGCFIIVTEYFESVTFKEFISNYEYDNRKIDEILSQIYNAMTYLHNQKIIHRDFNMNNILIDPLTYSIKIIDFGLSKFYQEDKGEELGSPQGNLKYRAPLLDDISNPYFQDVWNFVVVALSLLFKKKLTSRKVWKLLDLKPDCFLSKKEKKTTKILLLLQNLIKFERRLEENVVHISSPIFNFNEIFNKNN